MYFNCIVLLTSNQVSNSYLVGFILWDANFSVFNLFVMFFSEEHHVHMRAGNYADFKHLLYIVVNSKTSF